MNHFHNTIGFLVVGCDIHSAISFPPCPPYLPHLVFAHPFAMGDRVRGSVFMNGHNAVGAFHRCPLVWGHIPIPLVPFNFLAPLWFALSNHIAWFPRTTVHAEGAPTAITLAAACSQNLDCHEWGPAPSSLVVQFNTVTTTASVRDVAVAVTNWAIEAAVSFAGHLAGGAITEAVSSAVAPAAGAAASDAAGDLFGEYVAGALDAPIVAAIDQVIDLHVDLADWLIPGLGDDYIRNDSADREPVTTPVRQIAEAIFNPALGVLGTGGDLAGLGALPGLPFAAPLFAASVGADGLPLIDD